MNIFTRALRNNYLPAFILGILISVSASAQVDTSGKVRQHINAYGFAYKNISIDSSLRIPRDTFKLRYSDTSSIAIVNDVLYVWNGLKWNPVARKLTDSTIQVGSDTVLVGGTGSGGSTNLSYTASPTDGTITSTTGTSATVPLANGTNAGLLSPDWYGVINDSAVTSIVKTDSITKYYNHQGDVIHQDTASSAASGIGTIIDTAQYYVSSSTDTLTLSALINKKILSVQSYPYVVSVVTGTPASDEVAFNYTTGGLKFGTALSTGQSIKVIYSYTASTGTPAVTSVNGQTGDATIDGSETKVNAGTNISVSGTGTTGDPYVVNATATGTGNIDVGSSDSTYYLLAGVIRPLFDTATNRNVWEWIQDGDHTILNFKDSIVSTSSYVALYTKNTTSRVVSLLVVPDETASVIARTTASYQGKSGAIYYTNGPYTAGSRVFRDSAYVYFSKTANLSALLKYNGSSWTWTNTYNNIIDFSSPAPTVNWASGVLQITNLPFVLKSQPQATMYNYSGTVDSLLAYMPSLRAISNTGVYINFWDIRNNSKLTLSTPPTNFGVNLNFGPAAGAINPSTEDFGSASNFWVIAVMKKNSMGNIFSYGLVVTFLLSFVFRRKKYLAFGLFLLPAFSQAQIKDRHRVQYENISTTNIDTTNYKPVVVNSSGERFKTYWYGSAGGGSGTVSNSASSNRLAYYNVSGTTVTALAAITASRALASDANGLPVASATTATELGYVSGVTSAIQTQFSNKQPLDGDLTSLSAAASTGIYYRSATDTWSLATIGSGLLFSGGTLSATGGGGGGVTIGDPVGSGTSQSVLFVDASGNLAQDNTHFKFNTTTKLLTVDSANMSSIEVGGKVYVNGYSGLYIPSGLSDVGSTIGAGGALAAHTTGVRNTAVGKNALNLITTGYDNSAFGAGSLSALTSNNTTNAAFGKDAGYAITSGNYNSFFGPASGYGYTSGSTGVFIGYHAAPIYASGNNGQLNINGAIWGLNTAYNATNPLIGIGVFGSSYAPLYTLHVGGTFGLKKDSIPLVTSATNYQTLVVDTTNGKVSRIVTPTGGGSISLTTTGNSGASTYSGGTLNVPIYLSAGDRNFFDSTKNGLIYDSIKLSLINSQDVYLKTKAYGSSSWDSTFQFTIPNTSAWDSVIRTTLITSSAGADFSNAALSRIVNVPNGSIGTIRYEASANDGSGNFYSDIIFLHYSKTVGGTLTIYTGTSSPGTVNVGLPSETGIAVANVGDNLAFKVTTGTVTAAADVFWKLNICLTINSGGSF